MTGRLRQQGAGYQVVQDQSRPSVILVLQDGSLVSDGARTLLGPVIEEFECLEFNGRSLLTRAFAEGQEPIVVREWSISAGLPTSMDVSAVGKGVRRLRESFPRADFGGSLFLPAFDVCLPVTEDSAYQDPKKLALQFLVAGASLASVDARSIRNINSWLTAEEIEAFFEALDISSEPIVHHPVEPSKFRLPGRPELEKFFLEYVLEPSADKERYAALGVKMPNGVLLYGPPGTGKSHTVERLVAALGWPMFEIDLGGIGSPFVHQTTVTLRKTFEEARRNAPSLVVLEEIDALAAARGPMTQDHKVEEVTELLRLVESASKNGILVVATTNRKDALDPAILRKGRFDHAIEVSYPTATEVRSALVGMMLERPHDELLYLDDIANALVGRPMSDVAWVVNEAARAAAREKKDAIEESHLNHAILRLTA
jgi:cell division protease FtsH